MLGSLITGIVTGEASIAAKRAKAAAGAYFLAGVLLLVGAVFLLVAAYVALSTQIGPLYAALALGGGFLVLGLVLILLHRAEAARQARRDAERRAREATAIGNATALALLPAVLNALPALKGRHALTVLGIAGAATAGYAIYRENQPRPFRYGAPGPYRTR